ncbi:MAG: alpha/beta hydrolase [Cellulomonas sp.]
MDELHDRRRTHRAAVRRGVAASVALIVGGLLAACTGASTGGSTGTAASGSASSTATSSGGTSSDASSPGTGSPGTSSASLPARPPTRTEEYLPGLAADIWEPATPGPGPVAVLIPGGGWVTADRSGLAPLASALSDAGMTVVSVTYRTSSSDVYYPAPLQDVLCAVAFAAATPTPTGDAPHPVVVVGHSAGANLAALAALVPEDGAASCPYQPIAPDALVGLAGPYDVSAIPEAAMALFGKTPAAEPGRWTDGNPMAQAGNRPEVRVLLMHGQDDPLVPVSFTTDFAAALKDGGHQVTVDLVPGADHSAIYQADVASARLIDWIDALP